MKRKTLALVLSVVVLAGAVIGGTLAWLLDTSDTITNTFTDSDIKINLTETTGTDYQMIPGWTIKKDPVVTLRADSEACYLFVKIEENLGSWSDNGETFKDWLSYKVASSWTAGDGGNPSDGADANGVPVGVYFIEINQKTSSDTSYQVLKDDQITVSKEITKEMMEEIDGVVADGATEEVKPTLKVTAYASQLYKTNGIKFTPAEAWENLGVN